MPIRKKNSRFGATAELKPDDSPIKIQEMNIYAISIRRQRDIDSMCQDGNKIINLSTELCGDGGVGIKNYNLNIV